MRRKRPLVITQTGWNTHAPTVGIWQTVYQPLGMFRITSEQPRRAYRHQVCGIDAHAFQHCPGHTLNGVIYGYMLVRRFHSQLNCELLRYHLRLKAHPDLLIHNRIEEVSSSW